MRKSNRKKAPKPAPAEVISLAAFRPRPTRKRRGRRCVGKEGRRSQFRVGDLLRLKTAAEWPTLPDGSKLQAIVPPMREPRRVARIMPMGSTFFVGFDAGTPMHDERIFELAGAEVIQFPARTAAARGLSALPLGLYELDSRGVVTSANLYYPKPPPSVVGLDFFDAIAPGLSHLRDGYTRFFFSGKPDYEAGASDREFTFVKVMNNVVVIVDRL